MLYNPNIPPFISRLFPPFTNYRIPNFPTGHPNNFPDQDMVVFEPAGFNLAPKNPHKGKDQK